MTRQPLHIAAAALIALALAGGGYFAGVSTTRSAVPNDAGTSAASQSAGGRRIPPGAAGQAGAAANRAINGRILSVNADSITVQVREPAAVPGASPSTSSSIVLVGPTTRLVKTEESEIRLGDLKPGDQVTIVGTTDASGTVSATAIVSGTNALNQILGGAGGGGRQVPSPSPTRR